MSVTGLDELKQKFAALPGKIGKKVLRKGAGAGAQIVKAAEIAGAPVKSGRLKAAFIVKFVRESSNDEQATFIVTVRQGKKQRQLKRGRGKNAKIVDLDAYYAKWVERGHKNVARPKKTDLRLTGRRRRSNIAARRAASNSVTPPHPFFAPALSRSQTKALDAMVKTMTDETVKAIAE